MKEIKELEEIQYLMYNILKDFANFCDTNNLRYYLEGGTLLGAVRHNGFIPWDDDIDVSMPRPDYEKFIELTKQGMDPHYEVVSFKYSPNCTFPFLKLIDKRTILNETLIRKEFAIGIFIDIFPIDGVPADEKEIDGRFMRIQKNKKSLIKSIYEIKGRTLLRTMYKAIFFLPNRIIGRKKYLSIIENEAKKYSFEEAEYVSVVVWGYGRRGILNKEEMLNAIKIKFVDEEFWCPGNYHEHLEKLYGNYMKMPPKEEQYSHHDFKVYWKEC